MGGVGRWRRPTRRPPARPAIPPSCTGQPWPGGSKAEKAGKPREKVEQAKPGDKEQYNCTDPESRLMKGSDGLVQGYNAQAAVEPRLQLIVGQSVTPAANDKEQIEPMVQVIEQQSGQRPAGLLADSGYCSETNLHYLAATGQY